MELCKELSRNYIRANRRWYYFAVKSITSISVFYKDFDFRGYLLFIVFRIITLITI